MQVQIYAFTDLGQAVRAVELGVDHIGFVAGKYGQVYGELSFQEAAALAAAVRGRASSVSLTMSTEPDEIERMAAQVRPDIIHISTDPRDWDAAARRDLYHRVKPEHQLMWALPVTGPSSLTLAGELEPVCDYLLLDSLVAGYPGVGATGQPHDWAISRTIVKHTRLPVILAGGLTPENVAQAVHQVSPWGVDSNTGTNRAGDPVEKDLALIEAFVTAARAASTQEAE